MLTQLQQSIGIAIVSGFISGVFQSWLANILNNKYDNSATASKNTVKKYFLHGLGSSIFFCLLVFAMFASDAITSFTKLNYFSITLAIALGLNPLLTKLLLSGGAIFKNQK